MWQRQAGSCSFPNYNGDLKGEGFAIHKPRLLFDKAFLLSFCA